MIPCLGVLVLNRGDLLTRLVDSIDHPVNKLCIIQNGADQDVVDAIARITGTKNRWINSVYVERPFRNVGVAPGWNSIIKNFPECPYWLISNNDTLFLPGDLMKFHAAWMANRGSVITAPNGAFSCFVIDPGVVARVGLFDENIWPIYSEDLDYMIRMDRAGVGMIPLNSDIGESNNGSWTIRSSESYRRANGATQESNRAYLEEKWGKDLDFPTPWNDPNRDCRDWWYYPERRKAHGEIWGNMENTANRMETMTATNGQPRPIEPRLSEIISSLGLITDKNSDHSYCDHFYEKELARYRHRPIQLVEVGILEGGSLAMWAEYFKEGRILGVDIKLWGDCEKTCAKYPNIMLALGNAYMQASLAHMPEMDIFIDDGPHTLDTQVWAVKNILPRVKPGGLFVIEDIADESWLSHLHAAVPFHLKAHAETVDLRHVKGRWDDLMLVVRIPDGNGDTSGSIGNGADATVRNQGSIDLLRNPTGISMDMMAERLLHLEPLLDFSEIRTVIDVGAAHGWESRNMARVFTNARVHGFEPTPEHFSYCIKHFDSLDEDLRSRITIDCFALNDRDGPISFFPLDESRAASKNTGVASKYEMIDPNVFPHEMNIQKRITVPSARMDTICRIRGLEPDIIWMDAQGSELDVLRGSEDSLRTVKAILTEVGVTPYYQGQSLKPEIDAFLESHGFVEMVSARKHSTHEMDTIYVRRELLGP
jgi:FkbM family methyltransferase